MAPEFTRDEWVKVLYYLVALFCDHANYHPQRRGQVSTPTHLGLILLDQNSSARGKEELGKLCFSAAFRDFQSRTKITVVKGADLDFSIHSCSLVLMLLCGNVPVQSLLERV